VLGDRTRMPNLVGRGCVVRGSAAGTDEGGLNSAVRRQMQILEAVHDMVLVETVGVGQTEHEVESLVDTMILVLPPASGDSLQGMKRGITGNDEDIS
jgi:LAO/AO transport system kinase